MSDQIGGNYQAEENPDGTFTIKDIPIFAEVPAGEKRNSKPIGKKWMDAAVAKNAAREQEGYLPPVHIHHHEPGVQPGFAGKLRLKRVEPILHEGRRIFAVFADIVGMPAEVFERVEKGFLPYRSVEIHDWDTPEIDSLALMDTEVPFFRLEMLTIGERVPSNARLVFGSHSQAAYFKPAEACAGGAILFRFSDGGTKMKFEDVKDPRDEVPEAEMSDLPGGEGSKGEELPGGGKEPKKLQDDEEKKPVVPEEGEKEELQDEQPVDPALQQVLALLQAIAQKMNIGAGMAQPNVPPAPVMKDTKENKMNDPELKGEIAALKAKLAEQEKEREVEKLVADAKARLNSKVLDAETEKDIVAYARVGKSELERFVKAAERVLPSTPPSSLAQFEEDISKMSLASQGAIEKFAGAYRGDPRALEFAQKIAKEHAAFTSATGSDIQLEDYLETNKDRFEGQEA